MSAAKVIFLNGPPRVGKDTLQNHLTATYENVHKTKFASTLKVASHILLGLSPHQDSYEELKDDPTPDFFGKTPREFYIAMSETFLKPIAGQDVFGYVWLRRNRAFLETANLIIVSDCGFDYEIQPVVRMHGENNCCLIRMHRAGRDYRSDSRNYLADTGLREADLNNIENHPENMYSDFVKIMARWGDDWGQALRIK